MSVKSRALALFAAAVLAVAGLTACGQDPQENVSSVSGVSGTAASTMGSGLPEDTSPSGTGESDATGEGTNPSSANSEAGKNTGGTKSNTTKNGTTSKTTNAPGGVTTERKLIGNVYTSGFPIVKDPVTLNVLVESSAEHGDFNNMNFTKEYEKMTGVKINWTIYPTDQRGTIITLTFASGKPADLMCTTDAFSPAQITQYSKNNLILPLDEAFENFGPNITKAMNEERSIRSSITANDGKIYSVPFVNSVADHQDFRQKLYINQTWLNNLNKKMPTTYAELIDVLQAFKNGDPNMNGQRDEIPIAVDNMSPMLAGGPQGVSWDWGNDRMYVDANGKVGYGYAPLRENRFTRSALTVSGQRLAPLLP